MTDPIRDAAQALCDALDGHRLSRNASFKLCQLHAALSAPQPAADERVAGHMRLVEAYADDVAGFATMPGHASMESAERAEDRCFTAKQAVESSARALLAAGREDAEMLDWVLEHRARIVKMHDELPVYAHYWDSQGEHHGPDAGTPREAIRAAMQKGTP